MPRYDFRCRACDAAFERRLSMSEYDDGVGRECPECGSPDVERAFSAVNVIARSGAAAGSAGGRTCPPGSGFT